MKAILITGSNRGLGQEFVKQYLEKGNVIIATCRNPGKAIGLQHLSRLFPETLSIFQLDVTNAEHRNQLFNQISKEFGKLDMLINNAGIISGNTNKIYNFGEIHKEDFMKVLEVNTLAPLLMSEKFSKLLEKSSEAKIINITSSNGSISRRSSKGKYSYCVSKAALNMVSKILSNDLRDMGIAVIALQPGWIKTDMGGSNAPMELEETISVLINLINNITISDTGKFLNWDGSELPW
ncbi:MAG: SDR family oxidoreductase [Asgard group archaeon]|nr:SDR family oxidoreductase [Asgard group archaeon]